jgi:MFS family permease
LGILLFITVLLIAACGLIYELIAGTLASYLLGDSVLQFSTIIGCYLFAMGIGSALSRYIDRGLAYRFVWIELLLGVIGGFSSALLFLAFAYTQGFQFLMYALVIVIGVLVGLEIPLLMRIIRDRYHFRDVVAHVLTFDYLGALGASLLFPILLVPYLGLVRSAMLFGIINVLVALWSTFLFAKQLASVQALRIICVVVLCGLGIGLAQAKRITIAAEDKEKGPLTWPEGNGWIVRRLLERVGSFVETNRMVHKISRRGKGFSVLAGDTEYQTEFIIFAAPTFLASYLVEGMARLHDFEYSPWLTANLTLEHFPDSYGTDPTWDNVFMESPTLGYVDATHQSVRSRVERTVWTFYWALADGLPSENRQLLLNKDWNYWKEAILHDLERVHHDIQKCVSRIDIMRMGHAMARPKVGAIFSAERRNLAKAHGRILFANSDLSGFSIFEEAQYRGVNAADRVLSQVAGAHGLTH